MAGRHGTHLPVLFSHLGLAALHWVSAVQHPGAAPVQGPASPRPAVSEPTSRQPAPRRNTRIGRVRFSEIATRGMVRQVRFLVRVEEVSETDAGGKA